MYGDFSIFKEKHGKYSYITVKYYYGSGKGYRKRFPDTKAGEREAKRYAKEIRAQKSAGQLIVSTELLLGKWIIEYIETYLKPKYRQQTYDRAIYTAKKLLPIYDRPLAKVTSDEIQALYNSYAGELAPATIYKIHKLLSAAYKKALITRKITYNPMDAVEPPKAEQEKIEIFTFVELLRLARVLRSRWQRYVSFFHLLLVTGMRVGELLALQLEDIDLNKREIHINKTKVGRTGNSFNDPKTKAGNRYIPILLDKTVKRIQQLRRQDGNVTRLTGLLFQTKNDNSLNYNNVRRDWLKICKAANIEVKHIHTFRHTFATVLLAKGVPVLEVSRILGHSNATTTLNMYGHAIPGYNQKLIEQFQKHKQVQKQVQKETKIQ